MNNQQSLQSNPLRFHSWHKPRFRRLLELILSEKPSLKRRQLVIGLGAMKSGTTWLSNYLEGHPHFFLSPVKEMNSYAVLFPKNPDYPDYFYGPTDDMLLWRMQSGILKYGSRRSALRDLALNKGKGFDRVRALAQLNNITSTDDYFRYFEERIGKQRHFGEISPSYAHLPSEAYTCMASLCEDVRFLFLMRDPALRAASHMRQLRLRILKDMDIDEMLDRIDQSSPFFIRSDYRYTLQTLRSLGLATSTRFLIYEDLFAQECMDDLCDWLGLARHKGDFKKIMNRGSGVNLTPRQFDILRERLTPIYDDLRHDPITQGATTWLW